MARLILTLLGGFHAGLGTGSTLSLPSRKAQALLAYLVLQPGRQHPRDKLAALLWGDTPESQARDSLRHALAGLRRVLPVQEPPILVTEGQTLGLDASQVEVDVASFEPLVAKGTAGSLEQAVALYQGDLLEGLGVSEPPFEEWLLGERERLRELALEALARLLGHQRKAEMLDAALGTGLRLVALDPLQEAVHRTLMRLYAEVGRRGAALRQYQLCVGVLQRELGAEPEIETKALYQEILRQRPASPASETARARAGERAPAPRRIASLGDTPLIGRMAEMAQLGEALEQAWTGGGRLTAILGEAGIGKTRLVGELSAEAERRGGRVLLGRAYEAEQILPFGPWVDAFRAGQVIPDLAALAPTWRAELARLVPEVAGAGAPPPPGPAEYLQIFESVVQAIGHLAARQPLLLVLEDIHWADEMTLRLLAFLARRIEAWPVLMMVTAREEELADAPVLRRTLEDLARERHVSSLSLDPLSESDAATLVRTLARPASEDSVVARLTAQAWAASAGNPFVIVETVRAHAQGAGFVQGRALDLPERVREIVVRRLDRLSERARGLVSLAAVVGREFDFTLLQRAAGVGEREAAEGVEELVRRRVLHGVGERFDFTHDRVREVTYGELLPPRRKLLHRQVAEALEAVYAADLEPHHVALGAHYLEAEVWDKAVPYLTQAGNRALEHAAHREAKALFEQALVSLGHVPESRERTERWFDLMLFLTRTLFPVGEVQRMLDITREGAALAVTIGDQRRIAQFYGAMAYALGSVGDLAGAIDAAERSRVAAEAVGDPFLRALAHAQATRAHYGVGDYPRSAGFAQDQVAYFRGDRLRRRLGSGLLPAVQGRTWLVLSLAELGAFREGLQHGGEAVQIAEESGNPHDLAWALVGLGRLYLVQGDLGAASAALERGLPLCKPGTELVIYFSRVASTLGLAYVLSGCLAEGLGLLQEAVSIGESIRFVYSQALALASLAEGHLLAGHLDESRRVAGAALELARTHFHRGWEAWTLRLHGEIAARGAEPERADDFFHQAMALAEERGMRPLLAHCRAGLAIAYTRCGRREQARSAQDAALEMYRALDMPFFQARAEAELARVR